MACGRVTPAPESTLWCSGTFLRTPVSERPAARPGPREYRPDGRSRGHTTGTGPGPGAGPSRAARRQRRVRPAGAQVPAPDRGADRALHRRLERVAGRGPGHLQIGRASWRERVGESVEIRVVAVSLKKKK